MSTGSWNQVPLLIGSTPEDALLFIFKAVKNKLHFIEYIAALTIIFETEAVSVADIYSPTFFGDNRGIMSVLGTDYVWTCSSRHLLNLTQQSNRLQSKQQVISSKYPVYHYVWNHALSFDAWGPNYSFCEGHVCHASELPLEFFPPFLTKVYNVTPAEVKLSQEMQAYWTNFAKYGDPNGSPRQELKKLLKWPQWNPSSLESIHFQTPDNIIISGFQKSVCDFWDSKGYHFGW